MSNYILSCCSTADLTAEHFAARNIAWLPFHYFLNGTEYVDDLGASMSFDDFYAAIAEGADTRTSQINATEYLIFCAVLWASSSKIRRFGSMPRSVRYSAIAEASVRNSLEPRLPVSMAMALGWDTI